MIQCLNGCGPMSQTLYEGVEIDLCPICAGVWLDTGELTNIIETREREWPEHVIRKVLASSRATRISGEEFDRELSCPRCNSELPPNNYQGNSGIIVNTCEAGHGIWLDAGELAKIQIVMEKWQRVFAADNETPDKATSHSALSGSELINRFLGRLAQFIE
jgi:Zn-finger nucleic acid-binding protein